MNVDRKPISLPIMLATLTLLPLITGLVYNFSSNAMLIEELTPTGAANDLWIELVHKLPLLSGVFSLLISSVAIIVIFILKSRKANSSNLILGATISVVLWNLFFCLSKVIFLYLALMTAGESALSHLSDARASQLLTVAVVQVAVVLIVVSASIGFPTSALLCKNQKRKESF